MAADGILCLRNVLSFNTFHINMRDLVGFLFVELVYPYISICANLFEVFKLISQPYLYITDDLQDIIVKKALSDSLYKILKMY